MPSRVCVRVNSSLLLVLSDCRSFNCVMWSCGLLFGTLAAACLVAGAIEIDSAKTVEPAAFSFAGFDDAEQCPTTAVVLSASMNSACSGRCRLMLIQYGHSQQYADEPATGDTPTQTSSVLQISNAITLPQPDGGLSHYWLTIECRADSSCTASPNEWNLLHYPSKLQLQSDIIMSAELESKATHHRTLEATSSCLYELNTSVTHSFNTPGVKDAAAKHVKPNMLQCWLRRSALIAICMYLQRLSSTV